MINLNDPWSIFFTFLSYNKKEHKSIFSTDDDDDDEASRKRKQKGKYYCNVL